MLENDRRPIICHDSFTIQDYYWSYTLIKDYSSRELTYPEDRLPGICAIAKMVQQMTGDQYLAGIWRSDLPTALLWQSYGDDRATLSDAVHELNHPSPYIAPSWSWARGKQNVILEIESRQDETSIVEAETFPEDTNNPLGRVKGGYLIIRGKLRQLRGDKKPSLRLVSTHLETKIMFGDELAAIASPDWRNPTDLEDFEHDLCSDTLRGLSMLLLTSQDADEFGLLLLPKGDGHEWVRAGTFQTNGRARNPSGHSLFHDSELRDITLV
ncbi:hypothetical protein SLS56_005457 [Neofusicoccum ribis]|uniref:HET domain protein n=1 Tax=Neofusicoccum ribis TaxID=45134 RepID=A0ABR3STF5_9PEZI